MSFGTMAAELTGVVTNMPPDYCKTVVNRAWMDIQRKNLWSWLLFDGNWTAPAIVNGGLATVTSGSSAVTVDATAAAAINAIGLTPSSVTQRQFRVGIGTIYNIRAWDNTSNTLTLDRNYQEASGTTAYMIYQVYFAAPVQDWKAWISVRDIVNFNNLITTKTRQFFDLKDPQRSIYYLPTHVAPYTLDMNPNNPTYQYQLFELWAQPTFNLTYQLWGVRRGTPLVNAGDTLPPSIGEDCVMSLARYYSYGWGEANWKPEWGPKPNFAFLMREELNNDRRYPTGLFNRLYREYRMQDRELVNNYIGDLRRRWTWPTAEGWYSSVAGVASPGAAW